MNKHDRSFITTVQQYYEQHGRQHLPWRKTTDPYRILVSEIMLQQTQVERVLPKYQEFIRRFPNTKQLATAKLSEVLKLWQGLGYNRRAQLLHQCAKTLRSDYNGRFPRSYDGLQALPGIGPYTAGAVLAFAYNQAVPIIETNIRTVYLHHFFRRYTKVSDQAILQLVEKHLAAAEPRMWYAALMDYGSYVKRSHGNPNVRGKAYTKQTTFAGSDRQIRGAIIRSLAETAQTKRQLQKAVVATPDRLEEQLNKLVQEGLVSQRGQRYHLPD